MTKIQKAQPNQSLLDMIIAEYGTLEAGMAVAAANNIPISHVPVAGGDKTMPAVGQDVTDLGNAVYIRKNSVEIGTLSLPELELSLVLKPVMRIVPNMAGAPHILGYYSFDLQADPGFIHTNPLTGSYMSDNRLYYETEELYVTGIPEESSLPLTITAMPAMSIPCKLIWTAGLGYMIVWSDLAQPVITVTFKDTEGNEAYSAPVTALDNISMEVIEHFMGDISAELISSTSATASLRLTRAHPPIGLMNFSMHTMEWLHAATGGIPDPLDPLNPNKTIVTLPAGYHTIGMKTNYYFPGGSPAYPSSAFTMVISLQ